MAGPADKSLHCLHAKRNFLLPRHKFNHGRIPPDLNNSQVVSPIAHASDKHHLAKGLSGSERKTCLSYGNQLDSAGFGFN